MHLPNLIHTAILAGNEASLAHRRHLARRFTDTWDQHCGHLALQVWEDTPFFDDRQPVPDPRTSKQFDFENFASVGLLSGEVRFICHQDGLAVLTNSLAFLSQAFSLTLDPRGLAEEMSRFIPERFKTRTPWRGVQRVPPGYKASLRPDSTWGVTPITDADSEFVSADPVTLASGEPQQALRAAIRRSIEGASSIVADLSGGMDSTSICGILSNFEVPYTAAHVTSSDNNNSDWHFAKKAATELGQSVHTLGCSHDAAGSFDSTFHGLPAALCEGIPTWVGGDKGYALRSDFATNERHDVYLVGVGGDELFSMQYGALLSHDGPGRGRGRYRTLMRSMSAAGTLRANARMLMTNRLSPGDEARIRLGPTTNGKTSPGAALADLGWLPGLEIPAYLAPALRAELSANLIEFLDTSDFYLHKERFKHTILESAVKQAKTLASVNRNFGHSKLRFSAPFLDPKLVKLVLALESHEFSPRNGHKHILKEIVGSALPVAVRDRRDKGELSSELYESFVVNRETVRRHLSDSYLVDLGVVSGDSMRAAMSRSMFSTSSLMELEELYHAEKWVRNMVSKVGSSS
ncbi:asparagine synthase-related protein [Pseudarthrobacter sp. NPDC058329]|uniref:asparagine synthase-related protein n=1 Tax=Pseudarthrobacter sp. NPDC058329 TaxID=3346448 RepID=UPI0036DD46C0